MMVVRRIPSSAAMLPNSAGGAIEHSPGRRPGVAITPFELRPRRCPTRPQRRGMCAPNYSHLPNQPPDKVTHRYRYVLHGCQGIAAIQTTETPAKLAILPCRKILVANCTAAGGKLAVQHLS